MDGDGWRPVRAGEEARKFSASAYALGHAERMDGWKRRGLVAAAVTGWGAAAAAVAARTYMPVVLTQERLVPFGPGNVPLDSYDRASLPPSVKKDTARVVCWMFVCAWEGYALTTERAAWATVTGCSTPDVSKPFRTFRDPQNPKCPERKWGAATDIEIEYDTHTDVCLLSGCSPDIESYAFRYRRRVWKRQSNTMVEEQLWESSLMFVRGAVGLPQAIVDTINVDRVLVTKYVPGRPVGNFTTGYPMRDDAA